MVETHYTVSHSQAGVGAEGMSTFVVYGLDNSNIQLVRWISPSVDGAGVCQCLFNMTISFGWHGICGLSLLWIMFNTFVPSGYPSICYIVVV